MRGRSRKPVSLATRASGSSISPTTRGARRVPRVATNRFIDRAAEADNQDKAVEIGIAPAVAWRDESGLSLTPTLPGHSLNAADLADDRILQAVAATLARLHRSDKVFATRLDLPELLERYYGLLAASLQADYHARMAEARRLLPGLQSRDCAYVASHNDPVLENMLLLEDDVMLIDWEFSAQASPYWDLATVCNAAGFNDARSRKLLDFYCDSAESMEESLLFDYRELLQLLSDCWMAALVD